MIKNFYNCLFAHLCKNQRSKYFPCSALVGGTSVLCPNCKISQSNDKDNLSIRKFKGMSIIETLIFIAIISIVLVTLTGITASIMRQMRLNYNKIYATHYAEELADWLRVQKDVVGWSAFYLRATGLATTQTTTPLTRTFCINAPIALNSTYAALLPNSPTPSACSATSFGINDSTTAPKIYKRSVQFSQTCSLSVPCSNARGIRAKIIVQWIEAGGANFQVEINTIYAPL